MLNSKPYNTAKEQETCILVAAITRQQSVEQATEYLDELEFLASTAGAKNVRRFTQKLDHTDPRTFIGPGKLQEIVDLQLIHSGIRTKEFVSKTVEVLVEKVSKKSDKDLSGRNSQSFMVVFPRENYKIGDFVNVKITNCTSGTLIGEAIGYSEMN